MIPTQKQIDYLEILFNDLQFDRLQRNIWLSNEVNRSVSFLDELSSKEASICIARLKELKNSKE